MWFGYEKSYTDQKVLHWKFCCRLVHTADSKHHQSCQTVRRKFKGWDSQKYSQMLKTNPRLRCSKGHRIWQRLTKMKEATDAVTTQITRHGPNLVSWLGALDMYHYLDMKIWSYHTAVVGLGMSKCAQINEVYKLMNYPEAQIIIYVYSSSCIDLKTWQLQFNHYLELSKIKDSWQIKRLFSCFCKWQLWSY